MGCRIALLVSGASGMALPRRLLQTLSVHDDVEQIHLVVSKGASQVLRHELGPDRTGAADLIEAAELTASSQAKIQVNRNNELDASIASGSYSLDGSAIVPCSSVKLRPPSSETQNTWPGT